MFELHLLHCTLAINLIGFFSQMFQMIVHNFLDRITEPFIVVFLSLLVIYKFVSVHALSLVFFPGVLSKRQDFLPAHSLLVLAINYCFI